jgi:phospholipid-translocating ATPase
VTILFCDIVDFDEVIKECQDSIIEILDELFRAFDFLCKQHGIQKVETVGKTYMGCGGLKFVENELSDEVKKLNPTQRCVNLAKDMMKFVEGFTYNEGRKLILKIGIHKG